MSDALTSPITNLGNPIAPGAGVTPSNPPPGQPNPNPTGGTTGYRATEGWYLTIACAVALGLANVPVLGTFLLGILGIALIYEIGQLLQGQ